MSQNTGTLISAAIRPNDSLDPIASAYSNEILGGLHTVTASTDRDAIIVARRNWGMMCYVINDDATYQLTYNFFNNVITNNANWKVFTGGSVGSNTSEWLDSTISATYTAPPATYSVGDRYLILGVATGAWAGNDNKVTEYKSTPSLGWYYTTPSDNATTRVDDIDNAIYRYEGVYPIGNWYKDRVNQVLSFNTSLSGASYSATHNANLTSYTTDTVYIAKIDANNNGTASLNINGLGDIYIKKDDGLGSLVSLDVDDLKAGMVYPLYYDGVYFQKPTTSQVAQAATSSLTSQNKYYVEPTEVIVVATYSQYLIYGDLVVDGIIDNYGQVVILNGSLDLSGGGTFSNNGTLIVETLQVGGVNKYSATFTSTANIGFTISHNLNTIDIITSIREGVNMITADIQLIDNNNITLTTSQNVTGRINIIGL